MTMFRKIMAAGAIAVALASAPSHLAAQEKAAPIEVRASMFSWFSSIWNDLAAWLADGAIPDPKPPPEGAVATSDAGGCLDPDGRCGG